MELLHEKPYLTILLDQEAGVLEVVWKGFTPSHEFRAGIDKIFEFMAQYHVKKTLTDLVEHRVISAEDQEYAVKRSVDFTHQYWNVKRALVTPKDVFARFGIKQVNQKIAQEEAQDRQLFLNYEDAKAWLIS
ncbi:MAG: hypothetical protein EAY75_04880 [Bacteroidetes bacterium]|nr:MAG: hypothetical protein EAY75_04880 [Bacteroidota bacterium]